jgi:single-stranded-DNA-specific exonuclease
MLPTTQWKLPEADRKAQRLLEDELGVNSIISQILVNRHILTPDDAHKFLHPSLKDLHNPFLMKDIEEGVDRVIQAISSGERIAVYGDYDADGITSVAVLVKFLSRIHSGITYYIPDRIREGYGLNKDALNKLKHDGVTLIITVDCGITDCDEVEYSKTLGMDTIVLDHHEVPEVLPNAVAAINPHRDDCLFPFKHLAGVGIVFNFLIALRGKLRQTGFWEDKRYPNLKEYLDLVALGTIGDISPLIDENRIFAKIGLDIITEGKRVGIKALREKSGLDYNNVNSTDASFKLIPRINAAGRIGSPDNAVKMLLTDDKIEASNVALLLDEYNRERQEIERSILNEILERIDAKYDRSEIKSIVLASSEWHPGVIGIVASKLVDRYYRPAILICLKDGMGKGSGRSIAEFNLYQGLKDRCSDLLVSYGGHRYAAGISIEEENIEQLSQALDNAVVTELDIEALSPKTMIDAECHLSEIDYNLISDIEKMAPFGNMNPEPILYVKNIMPTFPTTVGNNHLRMRLNENDINHDCIWFSKGHLLNLISESRIDAAFTPHINNWNGRSAIQLKLKDVSMAGKA